tara:strand:- start:126 stop:311 length:186 start_codon:yes stop_codon:yes gene_type:complete
MYPIFYENIDYGRLTDMTENNKRLCKDLCKVGLCLSCFCIFYLILFLDVINSELDINITLF